MEDIWYHGTLERDISRFKSFSHFGNRFSATVAAARRNLLLENENTRYLIKTQISLESSKVLTIKDWGKNDPISLCDELHKHYKKDDPSLSYKFETIRRQGIKLKFDNQYVAELLNNDVANELMSLGYNALAYTNVVEKEADDEVSICVIDTSIVNILSVEEFTDEELLNATKFVKEKHGASFNVI